MDHEVGETMANQNLEDLSVSAEVSKLLGELEGHLLFDPGTDATRQSRCVQARPVLCGRRRGSWALMDLHDAVVWPQPEGDQASLFPRRPGSRS